MSVCFPLLICIKDSILKVLRFFITKILININYVTTNITYHLNALRIVDGTFPSHVFCITFFVPMCSIIFIIMTAKSRFPDRIKVNLECSLFNLVILLAVTKPCCYYTFLLVLSLLSVLGFTLIYVFLQVRSRQYGQIKKAISEIQYLDNFNWKFIGDYRAHLLLATSICILAVDFTIFPTLFSKTKTFGWSLMDTGVGSFVFVNGLCSPDARKSKTKNSFKKCMLSSVPLFIFGVIRLAVTTAVGYHKAVSEYGIHWNFFFTLSITKIICYFVSVCFFFIPSGLLAVSIAIFHQTLLSNGMTDFILSDLRRNFIEANKEGICSLLGFVSIYFFGVQFGRLLWKKRNKITDFLYLLIELLFFGFLGWTLMFIMHKHIQPVSRRMANSSYCIWIVTLTSLQIAVHLMYWIIMFIISRIMQKDFSESLLYKAINYNGLFYFLLANILTGLVNLSVKTKSCDKGLSFCILIIYQLALTIPTVILYKKSIQLKFW